MQKTEKPKARDGATGRAILIGLVLVALNVYWVTITEMKYRAEATALPIFIYPIFILFWLVVFNSGVSKLWTWIRLAPGELLTVYAMLVISTSIASYGMLQDLFAFILHPYQFATPENEWKELFFHHIPPWFTVSSPDVVLTGYYEGDSSFYEAKHLKAWIRPMLIWTVFTLVLLFMLHCLIPWFVGSGCKRNASHFRSSNCRWRWCSHHDSFGIVCSGSASRFPPL
ncbi:MAG: hypothetical protein O7E52_20660 [Candidatus Poribacteria bacterium]|nr:hypothetical protein [Candidatus Poribacteria bacterium]